ncbi:hypothetical protein D9M68_836760 [compost metagenome]
MIMLSATETPVATNWVWPETKAETVALLSSKRLMSVLAGTTLVSSWSSMAPRVTATDLPPRALKSASAAALGPYTAWKNGE